MDCFDWIISPSIASGVNPAAVWGAFHISTVPQSHASDVLSDLIGYVAPFAIVQSNASSVNTTQLTLITDGANYQKIQPLIGYAHTVDVKLFNGMLFLRSPNYATSDTNGTYLNSFKICCAGIVAIYPLKP